MLEFLNILDTESTAFQGFGWAYFAAIVLTILMILLNHFRPAKLRTMVLLYVVPALLLEVVRQVYYSFTVVNGQVMFNYQWRYLPLQLFNFPVWFGLAALFSRRTVRETRYLSFIAYTSLITNIISLFTPGDYLTGNVFTSVYALFIRCGAIILGTFIIENENLSIKSDLAMVLKLCLVSEVLNCAFYWLKISPKQELNLLYISPFYRAGSSIVMSMREEMPFYVFIILYVYMLLLGSLLVYGLDFMLTDWKRKRKMLLSLER